MTLWNSFTTLRQSRVAYYREYTYNAPIMMTREQNDNMSFVQECLHACIRYAASNIHQFSHLMPLSARAAEILAICERYPYRPGTYRTDFVVTSDNRIRIIEITARFALNGFIRSGIVNSLAEHWASERAVPTRAHYPGFFDDLTRYFGGREDVVILKNDSFNEGKYLTTLFGSAGYRVEVLELDDIARNADRLPSATCISQLRHDELFALPDDVIDAMMQGNLLNDLRTVLLVHDKRFFRLLWDDTFRDHALGPERSAAFRHFLTPTFTPLADPDLWARLPRSEEDWIIKPTALGMGIGITSSTAVSAADWQEALGAADAASTVFQPYLPQRRFSGTVGDEPRLDDYVTGTLLYFEGGYYGPGMFRASSHPVINVADDRKIAGATLDVDIDDLDPRFRQEMVLL